MKNFNKYVGKYRIVFPYSYDKVNGYEFLTEEDGVDLSDCIIPLALGEDEPDYYKRGYIGIYNDNCLLIYIENVDIGKTIYGELRKLSMIYERKSLAECKDIHFLAKNEILDSPECVEILKIITSGAREKCNNRILLPEYALRKYKIKYQDEIDKLLLFISTNHNEEVVTKQHKMIYGLYEEAYGIDIPEEASRARLKPMEYIDKNNLYREIGELLGVQDNEREDEENT